MPAALARERAAATPVPAVAVRMAVPVVAVVLVADRVADRAVDRAVAVADRAAVQNRSFGRIEAVHQWQVNAVVLDGITLNLNSPVHGKEGLYDVDAFPFNFTRCLGWFGCNCHLRHGDGSRCRSGDGRCPIEDHHQQQRQRRKLQTEKRQRQYDQGHYRVPVGGR
ncbi:hypothetical protein DESC_610234 [Desulfosarcina cetonica]|nr:hypothetical protein DESC_610234 [Desulfosarcina cetonica]